MKKENYERYLTKQECRIIEIMDCESVMRDLTDYYKMLLSPEEDSFVIETWLRDSYTKIVTSHDKFKERIRT